MIELTSFKSVEQITENFSRFLNHKLQSKKRILWLISGGSNLDIEAAIWSRIPDDLTAKLTIALIDERYGEYDHDNSNMAQFKNRIDNLKSSNLIEVLQPSNPTLKTTTLQYSKNLTDILLDENTYTIGQIGMGTDGHIAGILPSSPVFDSNDFIDYYSAKDFQRITLTPIGLSLINHIVLVATDPSKNQLVNQIMNSSSTDVIKFPGLLLRQFEQVSIYNINKQ